MSFPAPDSEELALARSLACVIPSPSEIFAVGLVWLRAFLPPPAFIDS